MKQIPTAKEFRISQCVTIFQDLSNKDWEELMIEFAKLHVQEALKKASTNLRQAAGTFNSDYSSQKHSILNSYSLDNIK